ncbi:hypothetical protein EYF80_011499 [Liparis tanakae]|uniref:Uncharacterized protein n=1 Tax=Liparis tanakae TaxID=230148 RepID=A0A4Z2IJV4_9TELE|nr:hypothetical protein EYF80_011499 [Liparis tanakae]
MSSLFGAAACRERFVRASDFGFLVIGSLRFPGLSGLPHRRRRRPPRPLVNGAPAGFSEGLEDLVAAADVQAAGGRGGGRAVGLPLARQLVTQSRRQGVRGADGELLAHIGVQRGAGIPKSKTVHHEALWRGKRVGVEGPELRGFRGAPVHQRDSDRGKESQRAQHTP